MRWLVLLQPFTIDEQVVAMGVLCIRSPTAIISIEETCDYLDLSWSLQLFRYFHGGRACARI